VIGAAAVAVKDHPNLFLLTLEIWFIQKFKLIPKGACNQFLSFPAIASMVSVKYSTEDKRTYFLQRHYCGSEVDLRLDITTSHRSM
jgi:hypothetical protein